MTSTKIQNIFSEYLNFINLEIQNSNHKDICAKIISELVINFLNGTLLNPSVISKALHKFSIEAFFFFFF